MSFIIIIIIIIITAINDIFFFIFTFLFGVSKRPNLSEAPQRSVNIKIMSFFVSINYFRMLGT